MNAKEEQLKIGSMVQERREIKSRLACSKNKINRYSKALGQTAFSMSDDSYIMSGFKFLNDSNEFTVLSVPGLFGHEKDHRFPSRD